MLISELLVALQIVLVMTVRRVQTPMSELRAVIVVDQLVAHVLWMARPVLMTTVANAQFQLIQLVFVHSYQESSVNKSAQDLTLTDATKTHRSNVFVQMEPSVDGEIQPSAQLVDVTAIL